MEENKNIANVSTVPTQSLMQDLRQIIEQARVHVAATSNYALSLMYWHIGMRINNEVLGNQRAEYGKQIVASVARQLRDEYGSRGFDEKNIRYKLFPNFFHAASGKSIEEQIVNTARSQSGDNLKNILNSLRSQSPIRLSWTHYRIILQENTDRGRVWYEQEAAREMWSTRTLQRNVSSHSCLPRRNCVARLSSRKSSSVCNIRRTNYGRGEIIRNI